MIKVRTLDEFQSFISMAKSQNLAYSIVGSEEEGFEGVFTANALPNNFYSTYALLCPSFTVYVSIKAPLKDKVSITNISSTFNFTRFKHVSLKDGILNCHN